MEQRDLTLRSQAVPTLRTSADLISALVAVLEVAAVLKVTVGLGLLFAPSIATELQGEWLFFSNMIAFGGVGIFLRITGRRDPRAVALSLFLVLIATAYADASLAAAGAGRSQLAPLALVLRHLQVVAFAPAFFWLFVQDFPRPHAYVTRSRPTAAINTCFAIAIALVAAHLVALAMPDSQIAERIARLVDRARLDSLHWPLIIVAGLTAIPYALGKARRAGADERRRVRILLFGLLLGLAPELILTLLGAVWPALVRYAQTPSGRAVILSLIIPAQLMVPLLVAYSVVVHKALDIRLIARRVLQYMVARNLLWLPILAPAFGAAAITYLNRHTSLVGIFRSSIGVWLLTALTCSLIAIALRRKIGAAVDRYFFRDQHDAARLLTTLASRVRDAESIDELALSVATELKNALHLRQAEVLLIAADLASYRSPGGTVAPLSRTSVLARSLEYSARSLDVSWERTPEWLRALPENEQKWLIDSDTRLMVPVVSAAGDLLGVISLGEKLSELPFSREELRLLEAIANSIGLAVEFRSRSPRAVPATAATMARARECLACGQVVATQVRRCPDCGEATVPAAVPMVLRSKFRFVKRIGQGGMGVVYEAVDLTLNRSVAVKTLPQVTRTEVGRLRREARAMAAVAHPNLAMIFGIESYTGVPMLVVELFPHTLNDFVERGALEDTQAIDIVIALSDALQVLHSAGVVHRDIKPSNIGLTSDGRAKLLDFGLATMFEALEPASPEPAPGTVKTAYIPTHGSASALAGTPLYLSPEVLDGARPNSVSDLWSLAVVLFECLAGEHPLRRATESLVTLLRSGAYPDARVRIPGIDPALADFLNSALDRDPACRPYTAEVFGNRLRVIRLEIQSRRLISADATA